jgi:adenylate cyclase
VLSVETVERPGIALFKVVGDIDLATAPELGRRLEHVFQADGRGVVLDLSAVEFMDSSGVSVLLNALTRMTRAGRRLALACPRGSPDADLLARTRLDTTFAVFRSTDEACKWLLAGGAARDGAPRQQSHPAPPRPERLVSHAEAARAVGVAPATLRHWVKAGVIGSDDGWTPAAIAQAKVVARLREAGRPLAEIRRAAEAGRLAAAPIVELLGHSDGTMSLEEAARRAGLKLPIAERIWSAFGFAHRFGPRLTERDARLLSDVASMLSAGLPLIALLQLARLYGQGLAHVADAEVRLFRLYVHEPLMAGKVPAEEIANHMEGMASELLPLSSPVMEHVHQRFIQHFIERDLLGELDVAPPETQPDVGRVRVAVVFADVVGYTQLTEELGEEEALATVERLTEAIEHTLPDDARIIKTIGDEVMIVGDDPVGLTEWAVGVQNMNTSSAKLRIGLHYGEALYRDGDYYGKEVNLAARVVAQSEPGKVTVTRPVVDASAGRLEFVPRGRASLKGFAEPAELFEPRPSAPA